MNPAFSIHRDFCLGRHGSTSPYDAEDWDAHLPAHPPEHAYYRDWADLSGRISTRQKPAPRRRTKKIRKKPMALEAFALIPCGPSQGRAAMIRSKASTPFDQVLKDACATEPAKESRDTQADPGADTALALRTKIAGMTRRRNWDGLDGKPVPSTAARAAADFFQRATGRGIPLPKFVGPSALGAIAFQWNTPTHRLKVRVFSDDREGCHFQWIKLPDSVEEGRGGVNTVVDRLSRYFR